jgi:hypothetical protein
MKNEKRKPKNKTQKTKTEKGIHLQKRKSNNENRKTNTKSDSALKIVLWEITIKKL